MSITSISVKCFVITTISALFLGNAERKYVFVEHALLHAIKRNGDTEVKFLLNEREELLSKTQVQPLRCTMDSKLRLQSSSFICLSFEQFEVNFLAPSEDLRTQSFLYT